MNIFKDLQKKAASIRTKRQSAYYTKLRRTTQTVLLQKEKNKRLQDALKAKRAATRELRATNPPKRKFRFNLAGDFRKFAGKLPSDEELNRAVFGSESPKRSK